MKGESLLKEEENFQKVYVKAPSFLSIHMGVKAKVLPPETDCHHFVLEVIGFFWYLIASGFEIEMTNFTCAHYCLPVLHQNDWTKLEEPYGSIFLSIPTVLDSSLAPEGRHILHIFTTSSIEDWEVGNTKY